LVDQGVEVSGQVGVLLAAVSSQQVLVRGQQGAGEQDISKSDLVADSVGLLFKDLVQLGKEFVSDLDSSIEALGEEIFSKVVQMKEIATSHLLVRLSVTKVRIRPTGSDWGQFGVAERQPLDDLSLLLLAGRNQLSVAQSGNVVSNSGALEEAKTVLAFKGWDLAEWELGKVFRGLGILKFHSWDVKLNAIEFSGDKSLVAASVSLWAVQFLHDASI
jgi:hypothetical protein